MPISNTYSPNPPQPILGQGSAVGNREDLKNILTILAPEETPILSSTNKGRTSSTFTEWIVDDLDAPSTDGISEGADVTAFKDKFAGRARLGNYVQKFRKPYQVSDLQEAVSSVGPAKIAQAEAKAMREIKRDVEATLCSNNDRATEDGAGQAYKMRGLGNWIQSSGPADVPAQYRTPAESIHDTGNFTETIFNDLITSIYRVTGNTNKLTLVADTALRRKISDFARFGADVSDGTNAGVRNVNYNGMEAKIKLSVEFYQSDHGITSIINMNPDCAPDTVNKDTGYLLNPEYFSIEELIPMGSSRLPNFGGGERGFVDVTLTNCCKHPGAHGKITAITA